MNLEYNNCMSEAEHNRLALWLPIYQPNLHKYEEFLVESA
jgi:hypothetical protein